MLEFKEMTIDDKEWASELYKISGLAGCSNSFGTQYIWARSFKGKICRHKDFLLYRGEKYGLAYAMPAGKGDLGEAAGLMKADAEANGAKFRMFGITLEDIEKLKNECPEIHDNFEYKENRGFFDYIYLASDLALLSGRKYHSKRNHISRFGKSYDIAVEVINQGNMAECLDIAEKWAEGKNGGDGDYNFADELDALKRSFDNYERLGFCGIILKADGKPAAFTIGEEQNGSTFLTHFEKTLPEAEDAYPVINNKFALMLKDKYEYINREDDVGNEGLRKSKLSYHPVVLLEKYNAIARV
ncbi:MAG: phosphatidylglycerol lysyltransferase domain-containing protein [Oscillospiraceae bacterium]|nr:phosphatidylglycerol lysyltransferase domain-containing protein [Oscillospiraceae bacterium]